MEPWDIPVMAHSVWIMPEILSIPVGTKLDWTGSIPTDADARWQWIPMAPSKLRLPVYGAMLEP